METDRFKYSQTNPCCAIMLRGVCTVTVTVILWKWVWYSTIDVWDCDRLGVYMWQCKW